MANKYLSYITDEHLFKCIENLHKSYIKAKNDIDRERFYENKIDTIKLTFDSKFNDIDEESLVNTEILRQIDKTINNFIGTFHEDVLGGISGFEVGKLSGYDIKAKDDTLFAEIKNKHNTMSSSSQESVFQKLANYADTHKKANCYWVQILAKRSFNIRWAGLINGKEYSHSRVFKISGDQFYALLTNKKDAFMQLNKVLPIAIDDYLKNIEKSDKITEHSALLAIKNQAIKSKRSILNQITYENFGYYLGFEDL